MELKDRILNATLQSISRLGVVGTTMDTIARECGISKRTLYEQFPDKLTLLTAALRRNGERHQHQFEQIFRTAGNVIMALLQSYGLIRNYVDSTSLAFFNDIHRLYPSLHEEFVRIEDSNYQGLEAVLQQGQRDGLVREDTDIKVSVLVFRTTLYGIKNSEQARADYKLLQAMLDQMFLTFMRGTATARGVAIIDGFVSDLRKKSPAEQ